MRLGTLGERPGELAPLLEHPGCARMTRHAAHVHRAAAELDEEEDVEPCPEHGVDGKEVAGQHGRGLASDELAPGGAGSPSSRANSRLAQELAYRRRRDAEPERGELASDPLVAPAGVKGANSRVAVTRFGSTRG
jgi:hypothetical protein